MEYTIAHALSTGILGMSNTIAHSKIYCVMSLWAIFHPLGHPYDNSCSYYINTMNCSKIVQRWLYHIIISVGDVLGILFSSSLRCLFLLHVQPILASHMYNPPTRHLPFNLGFWSEYLWNTMRMRYIIVEAMGFGIWTWGIGLLLTKLW